MGPKLNTTNYNNNDLRKRFVLELKELFEFKNFIYKVIFIYRWFFYSGGWKILFSTKRLKAYSTFSVLVDRSYIKSLQVILLLFLLLLFLYFKNSGRPPRTVWSILLVIKMILQLSFQTFVAFLVLWLTLFYERWENHRMYIRRTYDFDVSILSGIFIFLVFPTLNLGLGHSIISFKLRSFYKLTQKVQNFIICCIKNISFLFNKKARVEVDI